MPQHEPGTARAASASFRYDTHARRFDDNLYVYAVLSRRAKGISIGINLNPDKICNFDCIYCQVDRTVPGPVKRVDEERLLAELAAVLDAGSSGELAARARADGAAEPLCRIADVAFSGDGEPTSYPRFAELVGEIGRVIDAHLPGTPMTLITNATLFNRPRVKDAIDAILARGGQVWAKLDAGTEAYYKLVDASNIPFARILDNIREEAQRHPLVIQSLFLRLGDAGPTTDEIDAWAGQLAAIIAAGGRLAGVQVTTVARKPPRPDVLALTKDELEDIARRARAAVPGVPVEVFPSSAAPPPAAAAPDEGARR